MNSNNNYQYQDRKEDNHHHQDKDHSRSHSCSPYPQDDDRRPSSSSSLSSSLLFEFPCWIWVVPHLSLSDLCSLRLVCRGWRNGIREQMSPQILAKYWLAPILQKRCLYLLANAPLERYWTRATQHYHESSSSTTTTRRTTKTWWCEDEQEEEDDDDGDVHDQQQRQEQPPKDTYLSTAFKTDPDMDSDQDDATKEDPNAQIPRHKQHQEQHKQQHAPPPPSLTRALRIMKHDNCVSSSTSSSSSSCLRYPLDVLFQILRIIRYIPLEMAIGFSGKYGRQAIPIQTTIRQSNNHAAIHDSNNNNNRKNHNNSHDNKNNNNNNTPLSRGGFIPHYYYYGRCQRRQQQQQHRQQQQSLRQSSAGPCPTCRYPLPQLTLQEQQEQEALLHQQSLLHRRNQNAPPVPTIHSYFAIQVEKRSAGSNFVPGRSSSSRSSSRGALQQFQQRQGVSSPLSGFLDLRDCHPKCFPNLPQDLVCPICFDYTKQTLVLSDLCYQSESGTEKPECHQMKLTFTPANVSSSSSLLNITTSTQKEQDDDDDDDEEGRSENNTVQQHEDNERRREEEEQEEPESATEEQDDVFLSMPLRPSKRAKRDRYYRQQRQEELRKAQQIQQQKQQHRRRGNEEEQRQQQEQYPIAQRGCSNYYSKNKGKKKNEKDPDTTSSSSSSSSLPRQVVFPPRYRDMFIPNLVQPHTHSAKYGMTIYCTACKQFALIAPAGLCDPSNHINYNTSPHDDDEEEDDDNDDDLNDQESDEDQDSNDVDRQYGYRRKKRTKRGETLAERRRRRRLAQQQQQQLTIAPPRPRVEPPFVVGGILQRQTCRQKRIDSRDHNNNNSIQEDGDIQDNDDSWSCPYTIPCSICRLQKQRTLGFFHQEYACVTCQPFFPSSFPNDV